jgi:hypothetical protein
MTFETRLDIVKYYLMDRMLKAPGAKTAIGDRVKEKERERSHATEREQRKGGEKEEQKQSRVSSEARHPLRAVSFPLWR